MLRPRAIIDAIFGLAWHPNGAAVHKLLSYVENAGSPNGAITPDYVGQVCFDTVNLVWYKANGTTGASWAVDADPLTSTAQGGAILAGAALAVTAALHNRRTIGLDQPAGSTCTLPAATGSGARFRFMVVTLPTSNSHQVKVANAGDYFIGAIAGVSDDPATVKGWIAANSGTVASNSDTVTLNRSTTGAVSKGEWLEVEDIAANTWAISGLISQTGTEATPFSAGV